MQAWRLVTGLPFIAIAATGHGGDVAPVQETELLAAASTKMSQKPGDVFSKVGTIKSIAGRSFRVSLPLFQAHTGADTTAGYFKLDQMAGSWEYDSARQTLRLSASEGQFSNMELMLETDERGPAPHGINGFSLNYAVSNSRSYVASNAFGAKATIYAYRAHNVVIAYPRRKSDDQVGLPGDRQILGFQYDAEIPMDGPKARQLVKGLRFVVEGRVSTFANGENVNCGGIAGDPTMANRIDLSTQYCLIAAEFERVSFQSDGSVLREWKRQPNN